jgi:hypothetical protein
LSLLVENVAVHQYIAPLTGKKPTQPPTNPYLDGGARGRKKEDSSAMWLEAGALSFGPVQLDAALSPYSSSTSGMDLRALQQE